MEYTSSRQQRSAKPGSVDWMARLGLAFLGLPRVEYSAKEVRFRTRKVLALLAFLAVEGDMHPREKLATLLWPEAEREEGRAALRKTLTLLRGATGADESNFFIVERQALGFNLHSNFTLDVRELEQACQQILTNQHDIKSLEATAQRYRGEFLEGFRLPQAPDFEDWLSIQRMAQRQRMDLLLNRLSELQASQGALDQALETAQHWQRLDPYNEAAYQRLMQFHLQMGNRTAALQTYTDCQRVLREELGLEPTPQTVALAKQIRSGELPLNHQASTEGPLVGRALPLALLRQVYQQTRLGQTRAVVIQGETGIGKTRLALEFAGWARAQGAEVLNGRGLEVGRRLPYQPVADALRSYLSHTTDLRTLLGEVWLAELSRILPELHEHYPDLPAPLGDEVLAPSRALESVARLGKALAARWPLVLLLDDLHWADTASVDLLHYVERRWAEEGVAALLLVTVRSEELPEAPAVTAWIAGHARSGTLQRIHLSSITLEDTQQFLHNLLQGSGNASLESLGRWLYGETGGQPLFMVETVKALQEGGLLTEQPAGKLGWTQTLEAELHSGSLARQFIPASVRELIVVRLNRLGPSALTLLFAGAVVGQGWRFEQVCTVGDLSEREGLTALDELLRSHLIQSGQPALSDSSTATGDYRFTHHKVQEVAYAETGEVRRRVFHRRALEMLESSAAPMLLAHHALAAGLSKSAFGYSLDAGDYAAELFALREALQHYRQAERLLLDHPNIASTDERMYLNLRLADIYLHLENFKEARVVLTELRTLAESPPQPPMLCAALTRLARLEVIERFDREAAGELLRQALVAAQQSGTQAARITTELALATLERERYNWEAAQAHDQQALELARTLDDAALIAQSLEAIGYTGLCINRLDDSSAAYAEARALYARLSNRAAEARCLCYLGRNQIYSGYALESLHNLRAAHAISRQLELGREDRAAIFLAIALLDLGEYDEALKLAHEHTAKTGPHPYPIYHLQDLLTMAWFYLNLGDLQSSHSYLAEAQDLNRSVGARAEAGMISGLLCTVSARSGDWEQAYTHALAAFTAHQGDPSPRYTFVHWTETEALLRAGDHLRARQDLERYAAWSQTLRRHQLSLARSKAVLAQWEGDLEGAVEHLRQAKTLAEAMGLPGKLWGVELALAGLLEQLGQPALGDSARAQAATLLQGLAQKLSDARLRSALLNSAGENLA